MQDIKAYYTLTEKTFGILAPIYNMMTLPLIRIRDQVVDFANPNPASTVLDIATGTGQQAFAFAKRGYKVIGVDLTDAMLVIAQKHNKAASVMFEVGDATHLRFETNTFDVTCISFALHDMPLTIREKVLQEMVRLTKRQGTIIIVDYALPKDKIRRAAMYRLITLYEGDYYRQFINSDLDQLLEKTGIKITERYSILWGAGRVLKATNSTAN